MKEKVNCQYRFMWSVKLLKNLLFAKKWSYFVSGYNRYCPGMHRNGKNRFQMIGLPLNNLASVGSDRDHPDGDIYFLFNEMNIFFQRTG